MACEPLAAFRRSSTTFSRPLTTWYCGVKFRLTSTARRLVGRSRTWPYEALTTYPFPRSLLMVLALAGDSTMTSDFATPGCPPLNSCQLSAVSSDVQSSYHEG